jgi:hypothetical protein
LNLRLNVTSETTASRSFYSDLSYSKAIAELRGAKYCISTPWKNLIPTTTRQLSPKV